MKKICFYLIKPSLYDDEGYVIRFSRGVLPSNTLTVLYGLLDYYCNQLQKEEGIQYEICILDEIVDKVQPRIINRKIRKKKAIGVIFLVGVQSNQFSRATDLALEFKKYDYMVFIGGFHVSGILSVFGSPDSSLKHLIQNGISLVAGEVEETLPIILKDIVNKNTKKIYNFLSSKPSLHSSIMPKIPKSYLRKFALSSFTTLDCGRGCPFRCSFCTIINVHGNIMRFRSVEYIKKYILHNYYTNQICYYFFTDDNFARNQNWKEILHALIELKNQENITIRFMI